LFRKGGKDTGPSNGEEGEEGPPEVGWKGQINSLPLGIFAHREEEEV